LVQLSQANKKGVATSSGKILLPIIYDSIAYNYGNSICLLKNRKWGSSDLQGKIRKVSPGCHQDKRLLGSVPILWCGTLAGSTDVQAAWALDNLIARINNECKHVTLRSV
jgi:hypothetical protein